MAKSKPEELEAPPLTPFQIDQLHKKVAHLESLVEKYRLEASQAEAELARLREDWFSSRPGYQAFLEWVFETLWVANRMLKGGGTKKAIEDAVPRLRKEIGEARSEELEKFWRGV